MEVDVAVLGGGPGGYTAAIRAAQLGLQVGNPNLPQPPLRLNQFKSIGQNPTNLCHADAYTDPCITTIPDPFNCNPTHPYCWYNNSVKFKVYQLSVQFGGNWDDLTYAAALNMYVCARGSGRVIVMNLTSGARDFYQPAAIPGVRFVSAHGTQ